MEIDQNDKSVAQELEVSFRQSFQDEGEVSVTYDGRTDQPGKGGL